MKIVVAGTRGFPYVQGGVETHCSELYPRLAACGADVTVICRSPYMTRYKEPTYRGVKLCRVYSPDMRIAEAIVHTFLAVIKAKRLGADVMHIHSCGPALLTPLARLLGMRTVVTHHGADYKRAEWGRLARLALKAGELMAMKFADRLIMIAPGDYERIKADIDQHRCELIVNGVTPDEQPSPETASDILDKFGLERGDYIIAVGRLVQAKGFHLLIEAWRRAATGLKLVIAGSADHPTAYSEALMQQALEAGVIMTGRVDKPTLSVLYDNAALFAMSSLHEGLPIALLEAMSHGLDAVVSTIEACRLPEIPPECFANPENIDEFAAALKIHCSSPSRHAYDLSEYSWDKAAERTLKLYESMMVRG